MDFLRSLLTKWKNPCIIQNWLFLSARQKYRNQAILLVNVKKWRHFFSDTKQLSDKNYFFCSAMSLRNFWIISKNQKNQKRNFIQHLKFYNYIIFFPPLNKKFNLKTIKNIKKYKNVQLFREKKTKNKLRIRCWFLRSIKENSLREREMPKLSFLVFYSIIL